MGSYGRDRYGQAYYGVNGVDLAVSTFVISDALQAILNGDDPSPIECAASVTIGGAAIPFIKNIKIERGLAERMGRADITILCDPTDLPATIAENAEVVISTEITFSGGSLSEQIFRGRVDKWTAPNRGEIEGRLECYDGAKRLDDVDIRGSMTGDVANWITDRAALLDMGTGFAVIERGDPVEIPAPHNLTGYRSLMQAAVALVSAFNQRYIFFTGAGEMVLFDPSTAAAEAPQVTFARAISFREKLDTSKRFNRVRYSNYVGYAHDFVTYQLTVTPEGANTITASNVSTTPILSGIYDDLADQAIFGVLDLSGGVQNNICTTVEQLEAYAESVANESQRKRYSFGNRFNPLLEIGTTHAFQGDAYFIARIRHNISTTALWTTDLEFWGVA